MKIIKETCYKGTRILLGNEKRELINNMSKILIENGFIEISIPIIQYQDLFKNKVGEENNNLMYNFQDRGNRDICLAPEYTAVVQQLSKTTFKHFEDVKIFYVQECFRGEKPQAGRYRQFTQLGVEILNPRVVDNAYCVKTAKSLIENITDNYEIHLGAKRGLDYYNDGVGFEITCDELGSSKQVCGGGEYDGGIGFAIGIDRLINLKNVKK
jgi:histidyl-tRNA synthetase